MTCSTTHTTHTSILHLHQALRTVVVPVEGSAGVRSPWGEVSREVDGLDAHARYEMWVKASTRIGEGVASRVVSQAPATTGEDMVMRNAPYCL